MSSNQEFIQLQELVGESFGLGVRVSIHGEGGAAHVVSIDTTDRRRLIAVRGTEPHLAIRSLRDRVHRMGDQLTVSEAARVIGVDQSQVRRLCSTGSLPGVKIGTDWLIPWQEGVQEYAYQKRRPGPKPRRPVDSTAGSD